MTARRVPVAAYLKNLKVHRHSLTYRGAMLNIQRYRLRASSCPDIYRNSLTTIAKEKNEVCCSYLEDLKELLVNMCDYSHLRNAGFLLFALSNLLLYSWYDVPYVYLTDYSIELGYSRESASYLISIVGILNTVGEIILGYIGDKEWININVLYATCMVFCGMATALVPFLQDYTLLSLTSSAFGFSISANYALTSIILVELISLEKFTTAYGLVLLSQGISNLVGPPIAGWLYDITGNYDLSFYLAGLFIALSGLLLVILPCTKKCRKFSREWKVESNSKMNSEEGEIPPPKGQIDKHKKLMPTKENTHCNTPAEV